MRGRGEECEARDVRGEECVRRDVRSVRGGM